MAITLRQLTGGTVAFAVWQLADRTIVVAKLTQAQHDAFRAQRGDPPGRPTSDAKWLMVSGGQPALNTVSGWPAAEDAWEVNDPDIGRHLIVATSDRPEFEFGQDIAAPPVNGRSRVSGVRVRSRGCQQIFRQGQYNRNRLDLLTLTETPELTREELSGEIDNHRSTTFDSATFGTAVNTNTITINPAIATQADRYLVAFTSQRHGQTVVSVEHGLVPLTSRLNAAQASQFTRSEMWDLVAPNSGGADSLSFVFSGNTFGVAGCISYYGVNQTTPRGATGTATGQDSTPTLALASAAGDIVAMGVSWADVGNPPGTNTPDAAWTIGWNTASGQASQNHRGGGASYIAGAASVTRTDALSATTSPDWAICGVSIKAAGGAPATGRISKLAGDGGGLAGPARGLVAAPIRCAQARVAERRAA